MCRVWASAPQQGQRVQLPWITISFPWGFHHPKGAGVHDLPHPPAGIFWAKNRCPQAVHTTSTAGSHRSSRGIYSRPAL